MTFRMPAETDPQDRTWLSFPIGESSDDYADMEATRLAWAAVANSISEFQPVTVLVDPSEEHHARRHLSSAIEQNIVPLDSEWIRDNGPTFVHDETGNVHAIGWQFNGWGWVTDEFDNDARIPAHVAELAGTPLITSPMTNEGGGIHVDGLGTVLLTETVQLDPLRNLDWNKEQVEAELAEKIGATNPIWFKRGLTMDYFEGGTRGHVDMLATIPSPGRILIHEQKNANHPDVLLSKHLRERIMNSTTPDGKPWEIIEVPAPTTIRNDGELTAWNYVNHLVINDAVIACRFDDKSDDAAKQVLTDAYPGRAVITIDAREIFEGGGGIHCITQQQPAPKR